MIADKSEIYQKAVEAEYPEADSIIPIEEAAKEHCPILRTSPLSLPGLPNNTFILSLELLFSKKLLSLPRALSQNKKGPSGSPKFQKQNP